MNTLYKYFNSEPMLLGDVYKSEKTSPTKWGDFCPLTYEKELKEINEEEAVKYFFVSRFLSFGDYNNSCQVERSNLQVFLEEFGDLEGVHHLYGWFGSECIAISLGADCSEFLETLEALEGYPVIDEGHASELEYNMIQEAWEDFGRSDLQSTLHKMEIKADPDQVREFGNRDGGLEYIQAGGSVYFDLERMIEIYNQTKKEDV